MFVCFYSNVFLFLLLLSFLTPLFLSFLDWTSFPQIPLLPLRNFPILPLRNLTILPLRNLTILLWHWPFSRSFRLSGDRCLKMFNISGCFLTDDRSAFLDANVVVFHHRELSWGPSDLPMHLPRPASQQWVWLSMEPPANNANLSLFNGVFNLTMSYRRDADISIPYGRSELGAAEQEYQVDVNRSCLVSWVVSRYQPQQARARVYQSLKEHLHIQVFGGWSHRPLPKRRLLSTIARCFFYLSFENSESTDYISEKLWRNAFQSGAVPVVLGPSRATYEALAPPRSFIHVHDFPNTADLATYLKQLAADKDAYAEYFLWRRTHQVRTITDWRERLCQICLRFPHLPPNKVYQDLEGWVNS
uniref:Fucosyltransferase n=1 Tax=Gouania willdenowi TaxID=441366 RepID=A0A8C5EUS8_GOUWI